MDEKITVAVAAKMLGVTTVRIRTLINAKKLTRAGYLTQEGKSPLTLVWLSEVEARLQTRGVYKK